MKKTILSVAIAAVFAACTQKPAEVKTAIAQPAEDTSGLAQYKQWKQDQQALIDAPQDQASFETSAIQEQAKEPVKTVVIYRNVPAKQKPVARVSRPSTSRNSSGRSTSEKDNSTASTTGSAGQQTGAEAGSGPQDAPVAATTPKEEKKGWSKAAKGAVIGAGSGAVLGAILTKDKTKGAVIGGIIGAAGGYAIGRTKDKKDGRY